MAEGHNTSLPPSRAQALSSSPSKTKTKAEEALFVLKMVEENVAPRRRSARQQVPKVHVQTGRFRPVSDRYPQTFQGHSTEGIADPKGLVAALCLGADAVVMGTRFLATPSSRPGL